MSIKKVLTIESVDDSTEEQKTESEKPNDEAKIQPEEEIPTAPPKIEDNIEKQKPEIEKPVQEITQPKPQRFQLEEVPSKPVAAYSTQIGVENFTDEDFDNILNKSLEVIFIDQNIDK